MGEELTLVILQREGQLEKVGRWKRNYDFTHLGAYKQQALGLMIAVVSGLLEPPMK